MQTVSPKFKTGVNSPEKSSPGDEFCRKISFGSISPVPYNYPYFPGVLITSTTFFPKLLAAFPHKPFLKQWIAVRGE